MNSRYDYMSESNVKDTDGESYPDALSIAYNKPVFNKAPNTIRVSAADIDKFWLKMYKDYGVSYYDDLLLSFNGVPYLGCLSPGSVLFEPDLNDMIDSIDKRGS